jgi:hypothetical protein
MPINKTVIGQFIVAAVFSFADTLIFAGFNMCLPVLLGIACGVV